MTRNTPACFLDSHRTRSLLASASIILLTVSGCEQRGTMQTKPDQPSADPAPPIAVSKLEPRIEPHAQSTPTFRLIEMPPSATGVDFQHVSGNAADKPFPASNGSGIGAIDYDVDGLVDLYFATGTTFPLDPQRQSPSNKLYRNRGHWIFEDETSHSGVGHAGFSAGVAIGDFNDDGFPDIHVACYGGSRLYRNCGDGMCENVPIVDGGRFSTSAAFFDADSDGLLDLYVCNYGKWSYEENRFCGDRERNVRIFCGPKSLEPEQDCFLRNVGDDTFRDATADAGLDVVAGRAMGVLATDVDADGKTDLYIANDKNPNFLFLNSGGGRFTEVAEVACVAYDRNGHVQGGMGVAGADVNRDGLWDLFVTNFEGEYDTLYLQSSPNFFQDVSTTHGVAAPSLEPIGWGTAFLDLDLDGWKDLIVTYGHIDDNLEAFGRSAPYEQPALLWKNEAGKFRFLGDTGGSYFQKPHPGRGLATADLDNDGDSDVVISHQDQPPALLRNDLSNSDDASRSSLNLRLIGRRSNRDAIGSRVKIKSTQPPRIEQIQGGGSYLSSHDLRLVVATPSDGTIDLEIVWPSGYRSSLQALAPARQYNIVEPAEAGSPPLLMSHPLMPSQ